MVDNFCNCPICKSYAIRVRRRLIDRITGLFNPSYRYQCLNYHCQWQGNIPAQTYLQSLRQHQNRHV